MKNNIYYLILILIASCLSANHCGGSDGGSGEDGSCDPLEQTTEPCDPLETTIVPIELVDVLIVGKDSAGTFYVVDQTTPNDFNVFVSDGGTLYRKFIAGSSYDYEDGVGDSYSFSIEDDGAEYTVLVSIDDAGTSQMAVVPGQYVGYIDDMGEDGELLTVLDESAIADMGVENLPGVIKIEYLAEVDDGSSIVVTRPFYDWTDLMDSRLFYGQADDMIEREILKFERAEDGGSTWITFVLDCSTSAEVYFGYDDVAFEWGEAYLTIGDEQTAVTRLHPESDDMGIFTFNCIQ
jgi:hypothetical protein